MVSLPQQDSQEIRALIHAGARRVLLKYEELEPQEINPLRAILEKPQYGLSKKTLLELGHQVTLLRDSEVQGIWDRIFSTPRASKEDVMELLYATAETGFIHPREFPGTDMTLFVEHFHAPLPVNGIKEQDFVAYSHLLRTIEEGKTNFVLDCTPEQRAELIYYLWQIGSRDLGRELIRYITSFPHPVTLRIAPVSEAAVDETNPMGYVIHFCLEPVTYLEKLMDGTIRSEQAPLWLDLAHELIHIRHFLDGTITEQADNLLSPRFHTGEEQRAITGFYKDLPLDWQHENAYRLLHDKNLRLDHMEGVPTAASPTDKIRCAIKLDSIGDVREILEKNVLDLDLEAIEECIDFAREENRTEILAMLESASLDYLPPLEKG